MLLSSVSGELESLARVVAGLGAGWQQLEVTPLSVTVGSPFVVSPSASSCTLEREPTPDGLRATPGSRGGGGAHVQPHTMSLGFLAAQASLPIMDLFEGIVTSETNQ